MHGRTAERHVPDLLDILLNNVSSQWRAIGQFLGIKNNRLNVIKQENLLISDRFSQVLYSCQKEGRLTKKILCDTLSKKSIECDEKVIEELKRWKPSANREGVPFHPLDCDTSYNKQGISTFLQL